MRHPSNSATAVPPQIHLHLLGSFRLEKGGKPVSLSTHKVEALLAFLALQPEPHAREKLAALLWGDSGDDEARHSLRNALAAIRKTLGDIFLADRETIQLDAHSSMWVDAQVFEQATLADAQAAINLYKHDLLTDFYDEWIPPVRERLQMLYLDTLTKLIEQARSESQYERAIELAHRLLVSDPTNERGHQHLMFCYAVTGSRAAALKQYEDCVGILREELDVEPSSETTALYERIKAEQTGTKARAASATNLPIPLTSFVGRQKEISDIKGLVSQHRLVTLTGSGGCGKTRLALEVANQLLERFGDGVWWVDLAPLPDVSLVSQKVAQSLGVRALTDQMLDDTLINFLRTRQVLLLLDNCEHLIAACANLVAKLLSGCGELKILTTSREALGITGELAWRVPSLIIPETLFLLSIDQLTRYDAVRLFAERAESVVSNWKLEECALSVAHVCRRLDGIPLAIELAAARMKVLSIEQIAARLDDRFNLLTTGSRTALPRQQTLRATFDWSYNLLTDEERTLFRRLSVFAGGWTLEAAERICPSGSIEPAEILNLLGWLADKSLILVEGHNGTTRYRMLETIRQYATEKLSDVEEVEMVKRRHAEFFVQWVETQQSLLRGPQQVPSFRRFEIEHDNLRAVLRWTRETDQVETGMSLAASLAWFWERYGFLSEGRQWLEAFLDAATHHAVPDLLQAKALYGLGTLIIRQNDFGLSDQLLRQSMALSESIGNRLGIANTLIYLGAGALLTGNFEPAIEQFRESGAIFAELGNKWGVASASANLGLAILFQGDVATSRKLLDEALAGLQEVGEEIFSGIVLVGIGYAKYLQGQWEDAELTMRNGLRLVLEGGEKPFLVYCIVMMASVFMTSQEPRRAVEFLGISGMLSDMFGVPLPPLIQGVADQVEGVARAQLGSDAFTTAWAEGQAMSFERAMAYVLR
jgi:predicted ATPase